MQFSFTGQWSPQFWITWNIWVCNDQCVAGRPAKGKNFNIMIFSDTINMINVKLCMMVVLIELSHSYHFQWPWLYFKVIAVSNSFSWKLNVLIQLSWNFVGLLIMSSRSWITTIFYFCTYSKIIGVFLIWQNFYCLLFYRHCSSKVFQTLLSEDYNLAWGLLIHTRFGDLGLVSRSQVCQNHELQIV